jgi:hypothetical protein
MSISAAGDPQDADAAIEETVAIYAAPDAVTAEVVRGALQGEGIDARIGEQVTDAYGGPFAVAEGFWGEIRVPAAQEEAARALIAAFESGSGGVNDAEVAAEAERSSDPEV